MKSVNPPKSEALAPAFFCLTPVSIVFARQNQQLQAEVQAQQALINEGALSQQIGANLLREMAAVAQIDEPMKQLRRAHIITASGRSSSSV